jgi:hypothetical protein
MPKIMMLSQKIKRNVKLEYLTIINNQINLRFKELIKEK